MVWLGGVGEMVERRLKWKEERELMGVGSDMGMVRVCKSRRSIVDGGE